MVSPAGRQPPAEKETTFMKTATFKQNPLSTSSDYTTENCQTRSERIRTRVALRKDTMKKIAKRAIRYRIPMEVTHVMEFLKKNYYPVCPNCKKTIEREYMSFCDRCGQKLGWKRFDKTTVVYPGEFSGLKWK